MPQGAEAKEVTRRLAQYAASVSYEHLPAPVVSTLKRLVLDTLGTTLAANTLGAGCREVVEAARGAGGAPEGTLLGFGDKMPAALAAFANGAMAHALNYDAIGPEGGHLGVILAAPFAVAERVGRVNGKEFLAALAAGAEVTARLAVAAARGSRGAAHPKVLEGQLLGYFGAAVGAGRVLRLGAGEMHSALGLALMQAAGTMQVVLDGDPPAKAIYAAFPSQAGVLSALLSSQGLGAECAAFEGEAGLFATYYGGGYSPSVLGGQLGEKFYLLDARFKPWPTSAVAHVFIEAALELTEKHGVGAAAIERVEVRGGSWIRPWCEPAEERRKPRNAAAAANSIPFAVATALAKGSVTLADFTSEGLRRPEAMRLAERTAYSTDDKLGPAGIVEITTVRGQRHVARVDTPLGHASKPLTQAQLIEKFRDCARYAAHPLSEEALGAAVEQIEQLERVPDVGVLPALLSAPP